jgi:DeoR/GlpR family transcriptional regulator of sugar metabolism
LNIATAVRRYPDARIILPNQPYYPSSASFASPEALAAVDRLGIPSAILSA